MMPTKASDYFTIAVTVSLFMHVGGAHSLLLPVCGILNILSLSFLVYQALKILFCVGVLCGLHLRMIDCLKAQHIHTTPTIIAW